MVAFYCDICGKRIWTPKNTLCNREAMKIELEEKRHGYFDVTYNQAVVNENNEVIHFTYADGFRICPCCREIANKAIWKAFEPIIKDRKKSVSIKSEPFPREPERDYPPCNPF